MELCCVYIHAVLAFCCGCNQSSSTQCIRIRPTCCAFFSEIRSLDIVWLSSFLSFRSYNTNVNLLAELNWFFIVLRKNLTVRSLCLLDKFSFLKLKDWGHCSFPGCLPKARLCTYYFLCILHGPSNKELSLSYVLNLTQISSASFLPEKLLCFKSFMWLVISTWVIKENVFISLP
jgi:hypothetical protein